MKKLICLFVCFISFAVNATTDIEWLKVNNDLPCQPQGNISYSVTLTCGKISNVRPSIEFDGESYLLTFYVNNKQYRTDRTSFDVRQPDSLDVTLRYFSISEIQTLASEIFQ